MNQAAFLTELKTLLEKYDLAALGTPNSVLQEYVVIESDIQLTVLNCLELVKEQINGQK